MKIKRETQSLALSFLLSVAVSVPFASAQSWSPQGPIPRISHTAVVDTSTSRMVVFGGTIATSNHTEPLKNLNDVWRLNGAGNANLTWVPVKPTGALPPARNGHAAVYAPASNRMIIFGGGLGQSSPCANDTWVLTNANGNGGTPAWIELSPAGSLPPVRNYFAAVYDPNTDSMIVFGGANCFTVAFNDVWVLSHADGIGGTPTWTQLSPSGSAPVARELFSAVYDSANNRMIVFGGSSATVGLNDVWVLSNANGSGGPPAWTELAPSGESPSARAGCSATYDATNNRMTIYGGGDSSGPLNDVWVLSDANGLGGTPTWTQLGPFVTFPEARQDHTAVYLPSTNKMVVFGGAIASPIGGDTDVNDVFVLSHANGM